MKQLSMFIGILFLSSCSVKTNSQKNISETKESTNVILSKLPTCKSNVELIQKLEFEEFWNSKNQKLVGEFYGQKVYLYTYEFDTVVNRTPIMFLYQFIGGIDINNVEKRMLEEMNMTFNDLVESAKIQPFKLYYSVIYDKFNINSKLKYSRNERFFTGGTGEMFTEKLYELDDESSIDFFKDYNKYSTDSDFLESRLLSVKTH